MEKRVTNFCWKKTAVIHCATPEAFASAGKGDGPLLISIANIGRAKAAALTARIPRTAAPRSTSSVTIRLAAATGVGGAAAT